MFAPSERGKRRGAWAGCTLGKAFCDELYEMFMALYL